MTVAVTRYKIFCGNVVEADWLKLLLQRVLLAVQAAQRWATK
jgi:hypothetical protein